MIGLLAAIVVAILTSADHDSLLAAIVFSIVTSALPDQPEHLCGLNVFVV